MDAPRCPAARATGLRTLPGLAALVTLAAVLPSPALLAETLPLDVSVETDSATGRPVRLVAEGVAPFDGWLGRSLHAQEIVDPARDSEHKLVAVSNGRFRLSWPLEERFAEGRYEIALWLHRIDQSKCVVPGCRSCPAVGYHMEGPVAWRNGRTDLAPTLRFTSEVVRRTDANQLVIVGTAPAGAYLGCSLYPKGTEDSLAQGRHEVVDVGGRRFEEVRSIAKELADGTYETALWRCRVEAVNCRISGCTACARQGFHLEDCLAYHWGSLEPIYATSLEVCVRLGPGGVPVSLEASGRIRNGSAFLGRSLFARGTQDGLAEGEHLLVPLASGEFRQSWPLGPQWIEGGYEIALWYARVEQDRCPVKDCKYCAKLGYHLEGKLQYKSGRISVEGDGDDRKPRPPDRRRPPPRGPPRPPRTGR